MGEALSSEQRLCGAASTNRVLCVVQKKEAAGRTSRPRDTLQVGALMNRMRQMKRAKETRTTNPGCAGDKMSLEFCGTTILQNNVISVPKSVLVNRAQHALVNRAQHA